MYTEWLYPLSSINDALTPRTAAYCWLQCRPIPSLADVAPSIRQRVGLQLVGMLLTQLAKCCLKWVNQHSTSSWRCPNVGLSVVSKLPRAHLPLLMVINLINCRPGKKTTLPHCSVCLSHQGILGRSFCIQVVYLDGWVVYSASTIRSSNVESWSTVFDIGPALNQHWINQKIYFNLLD